MEYVLSVRVPAHWEGRFTSDQLREWVLEWMRDPVVLWRDPGPGRYKLSVRFSGTERLQLRRRSRRSVSSTIRAIAALHISGEQSTGSKWFNITLQIGFVLLALFLKSTRVVGHAEDEKAQ